MPKVNLGKPKVDPLVEKILGRMACLGLTIADMAGPGMSENTLRRRLKDPGSFRRDEIRCLARRLDIPMDEMRGYV